MTLPWPTKEEVQKIKNLFRRIHYRARKNGCNEKCERRSPYDPMTVNMYRRHQGNMPAICRECSLKCSVFQSAVDLPNPPKTQNS